MVVLSIRHWSSLAAIAILALMPAVTVAQQPSAVVAGRLQMPDGALQSGSGVAISKGKIDAIRPAAEFAEADNVDRYPDGVICPGLIDIRSEIGAYGRNSESAHSIDPAVSAVDLLDTRHGDFRAALTAGITTVMIAPSNNNLVSGAAVVVKTDGGPEAVLRANGPLVFALGPSVWAYDRAPTSRVGSLLMLRDALNAAKAGNGHERMKAFASGKADGICYCAEPMDVDAAVRTLDLFGGRVSVVYNGTEFGVVDLLASAGWPLIVGPLTFDKAPRALMLAGRAAQAGVPVAFAGGLPVQPSDSLRISGALAARNGMSMKAARAAMASIPAMIAGVEGRVGSIRQGLDADLVVFSGDPLRLDSRVLAVYVNGRRVYVADESGTGGGA